MAWIWLVGGIVVGLNIQAGAQVSFLCFKEH
jgi:hypothetical protein